MSETSSSSSNIRSLTINIPSIQQESITSEVAEEIHSSISNTILNTVIQNQPTSSSAEEKEAEIAEETNIEEKKSCSVCYCELEVVNSVVTPCNHFYCNTCFFRWLGQKETCAMCRKVLLSNDQVEERALALDDITEDLAYATGDLLRTRANIRREKKKLRKIKKDADDYMRRQISLREMLEKTRSLCVYNMKLNDDLNRELAMKQSTLKLMANYRKEWEELYSLDQPDDRSEIREHYRYARRHSLFQEYSSQSLAELAMSRSQRSEQSLTENNSSENVIIDLTEDTDSDTSDAATAPDASAEQDASSVNIPNEEVQSENSNERQNTHIIFSSSSDESNTTDTNSSPPTPSSISDTITSEYQAAPVEIAPTEEEKTPDPSPVTEEEPEMFIFSAGAAPNENNYRAPPAPRRRRVRPRIRSRQRISFHSEENSPNETQSQNTIVNPFNMTDIFEALPRNTFANQIQNNTGQ